MASRRRAEPDPSLLHTALIPLSLVLFFFLVYGLHWSLAVALVGTAPLVAGFFLAPLWAKASVGRFDREAVRALMSGKLDRLDGVFARSLGMRAFAPGAIVAARRGMIAAEQGRLHEAHRAYRKALRGYEDPECAPLSVQLGYAHTHYALGHDDEAIATYRRLFAQEGGLPRVRRNLAHALIRKGESVPEALKLLEAAKQETSHDAAVAELQLVEALAHARLGHKQEARRLRRDATEVDTELAKELRAELDEALGS